MPNPKKNNFKRWMFALTAPYEPSLMYLLWAWIFLFAGAVYEYSWPIALVGGVVFFFYTYFVRRGLCMYDALEGDTSYVAIEKMYPGRMSPPMAEHKASYASGSTAVFINQKTNAPAGAKVAGAGAVAIGSMAVFAGMKDDAHAMWQQTGVHPIYPSVNTDGTPMVHGTNIDIHGQFYGSGLNDASSDYRVNTDGTPMIEGMDIDIQGHAFGMTDESSMFGGGHDFGSDLNSHDTFGNNDMSSGTSMFD